MKKILLLLLLAGATCYGQSNDLQPNENRNRTEVKVNAFSAALGAIDFEFERTLNKRSSIGLSFLANLKNSQSAPNPIPNEPIGLNNKTSISAFYRHYFGKKYAQGFFLEGFALYNTVDNLVGVAFPLFSMGERGYETIHDVGLGLGLGYKWVSEKGLVLQANFGLGRNLFNGDIGEEIIGKAGISIGYRF
jgi:hypothetical protein